MFDLVVQTTVPEVGKRMGLDIAGRQHLLVEKIQRAVSVYNEHPFMVRRDNRTQVQAKKRLVDDHEQHRLPGVQLPEQQANVDDVVQGQEERLGEGMLCFLQPQEMDTQDQERHRSEHVDWELKIGLVFHQEPLHPLRLACLFFRENGEWSFNIRVAIELVGMAVMPIVLLDPPAPTPADQQIAHQQTADSVLPGCAKYLPVPNIVGKETDLCDDKAQIDGIQKLEPEVVYQEQEGQADGEQAQGQENLVGIVGELLIQQPLLLDDLPQPNIAIG